MSNRTKLPLDKNSDFYADIAMSQINGFDPVFKFGRSQLVTTTESIVWDGGGNYVFLETAETMDIVSTSTDDTTTGTGARTMVVYGLDADYLEVFEVVPLNGTTIVTTTQAFLRVFRAIVITSGTNDPINDANKGDVTITGHDTSTLQAKILINNGQTLMAVYTIPAGKTGFVVGGMFATGQGKECYFKGKFRNGATSSHAFSVKFAIDLYETPFNGEFKMPLVVPEKTDAVITAITVSGTINATASFGMFLVDNSKL